MERKDIHHLMFNRTAHESSRIAKNLRQHPSLQFMGERSVHEELHENCPAVPLLGNHALLIVQREFIPDKNKLKSVDNLLKAIEISAHHPRTHVLEKSLAQLAIWSIEEQIPYLKEMGY